jgi:outer membrane receptor for ferrienterochelin and colicins
MFKLKKNLKVVVLIVGVLSICNGLCFAEKVKLDKIVVTPSRTEEYQGDSPRKVEVITAADIEASGAQDVSDVLTSLGSVNINSNGGLGAQKTIHMRGSSAAQVLVMVDGRPINSPRDGMVDLSAIPLDNIDRIEVVYGPSSSLYGSQAMGGTVNIITKNPPEGKPRTESTTTFGSFEEFSQRIYHGARIKKLSYLLTGTYESDRGFRENSEFKAEDLNMKLGYQLNATNNFIFNSGVYHSRVGVPGSTVYPSSTDKQKVDSDFFDLSWDFKPSTDTTLSMKAYQTSDRMEYVQMPLSENSIQTTKARGINLRVAQGFYKFYELIMGLDYVQNFNDSTTTAKHYYDVWAVYMENQFEFFERLKLTVGARLDSYSNFDTEFDPSGTITYKLDDDNKVHALISRSFRVPTFNDLYWPSSTSWGYTVSGNPNLKPEKGVTVEVGYNTKISDLFSGSLTYYRSSFSQLINWVDEGMLWHPININSAVVNGIEAQGNLYLTENFEFDTNYTMMIAKDTETHKYLIYQPVNKVDIILKYKDKKGLLCQFTGQYVDPRFHDSANNIKVKKYFLARLNISKKFKEGFTYFITLDNLFNARYQSQRNYPMPLYSMSGGVKAEF